MRKIMLISLLIAVTLFAQAPKQHWGETNPTSRLYVYDWCRDWNSPKAVYYFNAYGDTLKVGHVVMLKAKVKVDSMQRASACDTLTIADSLDNLYWSQIRAKTLNAATACSLDITGLDTVDAAQTETVILNGAAGTVAYSGKYWRKVSLLVMRNGAANDTFVVYGQPFMAVTATLGAANTSVAGVVAAQSLAGTYVKVYTEGVCQAYLIGATTEVVPGMYIETSATAGYGQVNATPAAGKALGKALEAGNTNKLYWIWLNP